MTESLSEVWIEIECGSTNTTKLNLIQQKNTQCNLKGGDASFGNGEGDIYNFNLGVKCCEYRNL